MRQGGESEPPVTEAFAITTINTSKSWRRYPCDLTSRWSPIPPMTPRLKCISHPVTIEQGLRSPLDGRFLQCLTARIGDAYLEIVGGESR